MKKNFSLIQKAAAVLMLAAMFSPLFSTGANAQTMANTKLKPLTEDQKILHVLNRLGFGAREGDVEKVKAIGINKYIEQQLNPSSISDPIADAKVKNLDVLNLSNQELFTKYPNQAAVLMAVAQKNGLNRRDLQGIRQNNQNQQAKTEAMNGEMSEKKTNELSEAERQKYQQEIVALYKEYNLGRPQQITQQFNASRILRATYSEKQLQEVMVDFWTNHFNVFANKAATRWFLPEYDRDVIRPNALGNFKDLLIATAKSPGDAFLSRQLSIGFARTRRRTTPAANQNRRANQDESKRADESANGASS